MATNKLHTWQKVHNKRVAEFHKNHLKNIENGNGLLARWEKFVYNKGKALFNITELHKNHVSRVDRGENGNGLLARIDRLIYNIGKKLFKVSK